MPAIRIKPRKPIFYPMHVGALDCKDIKREDGMADNNGIIAHHIDRKAGTDIVMM